MNEYLLKLYKENDLNKNLIFGLAKEIELTKLKILFYPENNDENVKRVESIIDFAVELLSTRITYNREQVLTELKQKIKDYLAVK